MRVDTTVAETNIHYPTHSSLLGDDVRVLTRTIKKITKIVGEVGAKLRDRSRSVKLRVLDIACAARSKAKQSQEKLKQNYRKLLESTSRVVGQAKQFSRETADGVKKSKDPLKQLAPDGLRQQIDTMVPHVKQVMKQTRARIFRGDARSEGKIFSLFEPSTKIIRKGKAGKPNEFGKMVKIQEAKNQIVIDYEVYDHRPSDSDLLVPAIEATKPRWGARRIWWRPTPPSTPTRVKKRPKQRASTAFASPIAPPKAPRANTSVIRLGLPVSSDGRRLSSATSYLLGFPTVASPPALCTLYLRSSIFLLKVRLFTEVQLVSRRPLLPIHGMAALCSAALSRQAPTPAGSRRVSGARA
jgi:hypothetical protein